MILQALGTASFHPIFANRCDSHKIQFLLIEGESFPVHDPPAPIQLILLSIHYYLHCLSVFKETTLTMNQLCLSPILFFATLLLVIFIGSPVFCVAANLRASPVSFPSEDTITVSDADLVGARSFLVIDLEGYEMEDLSKMSPKEHAVLNCAFREAFDEVHGNRDGLYLSGQQIVASDEAKSDNDDDEDEDSDAGMIDAPTQAPRPVVEFRHRPYVRRPRVFKKKSRPRPTFPPPKPPPRQKQNEPKVEWNIYWWADMSGRCNMCKYHYSKLLRS